MWCSEVTDSGLYKLQSVDKRLAQSSAIR